MLYPPELRAHTAADFIVLAGTCASTFLLTHAVPPFLSAKNKPRGAYPGPFIPVPFTLVAVVSVVVPIIVPVPVAIRTPLVPVRIVPGVSSTPTTVPRLIQFCPGIVRLATVFAMLVSFFPVVVLRLLNPALTIGAIVGRRSGRNRYNSRRSQRSNRKYA